MKLFNITITPVIIYRSHFVARILLLSLEALNYQGIGHEFPSVVVATSGLRSHHEVKWAFGKQVGLCRYSH